MEQLLRTISTPSPPLHLPLLTLSHSRPNPSQSDKSRVSRVRFRALSSSPSSPRMAATTETDFFPNARRRKIDPLWSGAGFSLGVDLGAARTGLALGKGFAPPRPFNVLELRGQKLELRLLEIAQEEEADELIVGLPKSLDGKETPQSNKVRSIAGRLAVRAAERGLRVYLQDEHGTSIDALNYMIDMGLKRSVRKVKSDAYSAMIVLERYFSMSGHGAELVLPKQLELQEKLRMLSQEHAEYFEDTFPADP
ncbi:uncharacterized protein [Typha latifolia]|uniref:uncharacterized protein n=1 Tax=Typha latifolia TaxID=4733 RepID=UPI003C2D12AF